jgi:hypothetical protein
MEDFKKLIKEKENPRRKGFDLKSKTWRPHKSAEGGTDTIGWGHKLTAEEQAGGYVIIGEEKVPFSELTEEKNNALFEQDWNNNTQLAANFINEKGDWNSLSEPQKLVSTELFFNMGPKAKQYKNFRDKLINQDKGFIEEINRTYTNPEGETRSLTERTDPIKEWYRSQTKKVEKPKKQSSVFTGQEIKVADASGKVPIGGIAQLDQEVVKPYNSFGLRNNSLDENVQESITTDTIDVSAPSLFDIQENARRSMMHGNYQDRMDDYAYAREQARRPYVNRYPVDSRGRGAYSTAAPMRNQAARMMGFAKGGLINTQGPRPMNNLKTQAQGLAALGRGGDSTLVHMQPEEVAGLQQLAQANGTSLTINPATGMPEAFNLGNMFKAALPIAAGYFTGGAASPFFGTSTLGSMLSKPIVAGALTGAGVAAASGDDPIMGAVTGGFGGSSGAGLQGAFKGVGNAMGTMPNTGSSMMTSPTLAGPDMAGAMASDPFAALGRGYDQMAMNVGTPEMVGTGKYLGGEQIMESTGNITPGGPLQVANRIGGPAASLALGGLEESDFYEDVDFSDPRDKYDPNSKLNLNRDTGIAAALQKDTGLRLYKKGGTVSPNSSSPGRIGGMGGFSAMGNALNNLQVTNNSTGAAVNTAGMTPEEIFKRYYRGYAEGGEVGGGVTGAGLAPGTPVAGAMMGGGMGGSMAESASETISGPGGTETFSSMVASGMHPANAAAMLGMDPSPYLDTGPGMTFTGSGAAPTPSAPASTPAFTPPPMGASSPSSAPRAPSAPSASRPPVIGRDVGLDPSRYGYRGVGEVGGMPTPVGPGITKSRFEEMIRKGYKQGGYLNTGGTIGDGMSDDIQATINNNQPAALSDGEFVVPADVVSHLGNGSSDAGAKRLYDMMDKVRKARTGTTKQGREINPEKMMPK